MKVYDLIRVLSKLNPEARVVIEGWEGVGYNDILSLEEKKIMLDVNKNWWDGRHEEAEEEEDEDEDAVLLKGHNDLAE